MSGQFFSTSRSDLHILYIYFIILFTVFSNLRSAEAAFVYKLLSFTGKNLFKNKSKQAYSAEFMSSQIVHVCEFAFAFFFYDFR